MVNYLPTLVVSADSAVATLLAEQLRHAGFVTDTATSCWAAHDAMSARFYGSLVCFVDPIIASDMECVSTLRQRSHHSWIILISSGTRTDARGLMVHCGADTLLTTPFSMEDLVSRLAAFARRSRPQDGC
jgi:DNA-binding response OmpR family regulator